MVNYKVILDYKTVEEGVKKVESKLKIKINLIDKYNKFCFKLEDLNENEGLNLNKIDEKFIIGSYMLFKTPHIALENAILSSVLSYMQKHKCIRNLNEIAKDIENNWISVTENATIYIFALKHCETSDLNKSFGNESLLNIVSKLLFQLNKWKGEKSRKIKEELSLLLRIYNK